MKTSPRFLAIAAVGALASAALFAGSEPAAAETAGWVDFGSFAPGATGKFIEVNLSSGLLKFAATLTARQEPQAADLLRNLRHVRVNVLDLNDANRAATLERVQNIRRDLAARGWAQIVTAREEPAGADVQIFAKMRGEEAIEGLVVTVIDSGQEAVLVNIVGNIKPEQIAQLAERLDIEPLKHVRVAKPKAT